MSCSGRVAIVAAALALCASQARADEPLKLDFAMAATATPVFDVANVVIGPYRADRQPHFVTPGTLQLRGPICTPVAPWQPESAWPIRPIPTSWTARITLIPTEWDDAEVVFVGSARPAVDLSRRPRRVGKQPSLPVKR